MKRRAKETSDHGAFVMKTVADEESGEICIEFEDFLQGPPTVRVERALLDALLYPCRPPGLPRRAP